MAAPIEEKGDGVVWCHRGDGPDRLPREPQRLAARGQDPDRQAKHQQLGRHLGDGVQDVLAVVQADERRGAFELRRQQPEGAAAGPGRDAGRHRELLDDLWPSYGRGQVDPPGTPRGLAHDGMRATSAASRVLPLPPAPVNVSSRVRAQQPARLLQLRLPPYEAVQPHRHGRPARVTFVYGGTPVPPALSTCHPLIIPSPVGRIGHPDRASSARWQMSAALGDETVVLVPHPNPKEHQ